MVKTKNFAEFLIGVFLLYSVNSSAGIIKNEISPKDSFFSALSKEFNITAENEIQAHREYVQNLNPEKFEFDFREHIFQDWVNGKWANNLLERSMIDTTGEKWIYTGEELIYENGNWNNYMKYEIFTTPFPGENQKILGSNSYIWVDNSWTQMSKISYQYTGDLLTEVIIEIAIGVNTFMPFQKYTYTYYGNLVEWETISIYETEWIDEARTNYSYDGAGKLTETVEQIWQNENWENFQRTETIYGIYNLPSEKKEFKYYLGNEVPFRKLNYDYSIIVPEQLVFEHEYLWIQESWKQKTKKTHNYNSSQLPVEVITEEDNNGIFVFTARTTYGYNASNLEIESVYQVYDGSGWLNKTRMLTNYPLTPVEDENALPEVFELFSNYPNPFNPETIISYSLPQGEYVVLKIYNSLGEEVTTLVDELQNAGVHKIKFAAYELPSGIYFYRIQAGGVNETKKMILSK